MSLKMDPIFPKQSQYVIVDWSNVIHRAIAVSTSNGFLKHLVVMLANYRKSFEYWKFVFALEGTGSAQRQLELAEYKGKRRHTEETLEKIDNALVLLNFIKGTRIKCQEGEADDAIASYVKQQSNGNRVVIITEDTDMWQLIDHNVTVKSSRVGMVTPEMCRQKQGVTPQCMVLKKALVGDKSDNIPKSVQRVGNKILIEVARKAKNAEGLQNLLVSGTLEEKLVQKIRCSKQDILRNLSLIRLKSGLTLLETKAEADLFGVREFLLQHGVTDIEDKLLERAIGAK